jgi:hypothetical protein
MKEETLVEIKNKEKSQFILENQIKNLKKSIEGILKSIFLRSN